MTPAVVERADDPLSSQVLHRRCVRDQETRLGTCEAVVTIAMILTMSRRLAR